MRHKPKPFRSIDLRGLTSVMAMNSQLSNTIIPSVNASYLLSFTGIIRCIEIKLCFLAAVSTKFFAQCWSHPQPDNISFGINPTKLCIGPNMHSYTMFSLVTQFALFVNLAVYAMQLTNVDKEFQNIPWNYVVLFHTASSGLLLLIASTLMIADQYSSVYIYVGCAFAYCAFIAFTVHFIWEIKTVFLNCIKNRHR